MRARKKGFSPAIHVRPNKHALALSFVLSSAKLTDSVTENKKLYFDNEIQKFERGKHGQMELYM